MFKLSLGFLILISLSAVIHAEEDDFEFDFYIKQKSTIEDFPFQEIGQDQLSDAAIAGALQSTSAGTGEKKGKPAYAEQKDKSEKQQQSELESSEDAPSIDDIRRFSQLNTPTAPIIQADPLYDPAGVTYQGHNFDAVER